MPTNRNEYYREWKKRNPNYMRQYHLLLRYGLTPELYDKIAEDQEHRCKICGRPAQLERCGKLHVDHLKGTKVVRGLLCDNCNKGLGLFRESISALIAAIEYLRCQPL